MTRAASFLLLILSMTALPAARAAAQEHRGSIRGVVVDPALEGVGGVEVRVTREATLEVRTTTTDERGRFSAPELRPGSYRIEVDRAGFGPFVGRVEVSMNQEIWLPITLQPGRVIQAVDVTAPFIPIDHDSAALHTFIDERLIAGLPLDGRNFLELALLAPGTASAPEGSASSSRGDFSLTINGGREDFNGFLLDGVYNVDPKLNTPAVRPSLDAIREFQVLTSTYDATFGRNGGGQINVITKSGANRMAGTAYEFARPGGLDSRNHFAPKNEPAPDYSRHQFGGSFGAPIVRDRTFLFADYERTWLREGVTRVANVPTLGERAGDFSQTLFGRPIDPTTGQPFAGGQIPGFFTSAAGKAIAALYPEPNRDTPFANFVSSPTRRDDIDQFDIRVDHSPAGNSTLTVRYSFSDRRLFEPFAGPGSPTIPGFGTDVPRRGQNLAATFTRSLSSSLVNDLRFGYNRVAIGVFGENSGVTNASVGLPALAVNPRDGGLSAISVAGFSPLGQEFTTPQESTSDTFQIGDTATWMRGTHLLKFGGEWYGVRQRAFRDVQSRGFLTFIDQGFTGNALADLLLGLPVLTGGARLDNPQNLRARNWSVSAHDNWRALPSLTISAGVRYDYISPPVDADDRANLYDPASGQLVPVGTNGMPRGGYVPDRNNVAPRAGFAWTVDREGHNTIRGGYGIYYNQGALATSEGLFFNPPFFNLGVFFPAAGLPPLTLADPFPASFPVFIPQSATAYQRDLKTPWMEDWNVNVQHEIGNTRSLEFAYVGSRGHDLISARDMNQAPASPVPLLRPNPLFADITLIESRATSRYNSLQIRYQQRAAAGTMMLLSYAVGRSTDDASGFFTSAGDPNFPQNSLDPGAERARSSFDLLHRFSAAITRDVGFPVLTGRAAWLSRAFADLQVRGVVTFQSGRPFTASLLPDVDNSNTGRSNLGFGNNDRPNVSGPTSINGASEDEWFNTAAFSLPARGTFGNSGRNSLTGPRFQNVNAALVKQIMFKTTGRLELRAEVFNLLDRVNYDLPDAFFGSPTFGRLLSAGSPRRFQFGVKVAF